MFYAVLLIFSLPLFMSFVYQVKLFLIIRSFLILPYCHNNFFVPCLFTASALHFIERKCVYTYNKKSTNSDDDENVVFVQVFILKYIFIFNGYCWHFLLGFLLWNGFKWNWLINLFNIFMKYGCFDFNNWTCYWEFHQVRRRFC